jgi:uncharacterized protein
VPQPVVHFEVIGKDPERLRKYFGELFGWAFDTPSPVAQEISDPESYGFLDLVTAEDGTGIRGGIGGGPSYESHAVFYVGVAKVEAALQQAERLGGTVRARSRCRRAGSPSCLQCIRPRVRQRPLPRRCRWNR